MRSLAESDAGRWPGDEERGLVAAGGQARRRGCAARPGRRPWERGSGASVRQARRGLTASATAAGGVGGRSERVTETTEGQRGCMLPQCRGWAGLTHGHLGLHRREGPGLAARVRCLIAISPGLRDAGAVAGSGLGRSRRATTDRGAADRACASLRDTTASAGNPWVSPSSLTHAARWVCIAA